MSLNFKRVDSIRVFILFVGILIFSNQLQAQTNPVQIFEVRKNLALKEDEPVYHDYYINAGSEQGLQSGMIVSVFRRVPVQNQFMTASVDDLVITVGTVKLLYVQKNISVARRHNIYTAEKSPVLEFQNILQGDRVDVTSARIEEDPKPAVKPKARKSVQAPKVEVEKAPAPNEEKQEALQKEEETKVNTTATALPQRSLASQPDSQAAPSIQR